MEILNILVYYFPQEKQWELEIKRTQYDLPSCDYGSSDQNTLLSFILLFYLSVVTIPICTNGLHSFCSLLIRMVVSYQKLCTNAEFMYQFESVFTQKSCISIIWTIFIWRKKKKYLFATKLFCLSSPNKRLHFKS